MEMEMELFMIILFLVSLYSLFRLKLINVNPSYRSKSGSGSGTKALELPPGSTGWPIIGETLEFLRTAKQGVHEKFIDDRRNKYSSSKVFMTSLLRESMAVMCTPAGNKFLFSNENKLVKSWWPANVEKIFVNSEKTDTFLESLRSRRVLAPFLKPDALRRYIGVMDEVTKKHLDMYWSSDDEKVTIKVHPPGTCIGYSIFFPHVGDLCYVGLITSVRTAPPDPTMHARLISGRQFVLRCSRRRCSVNLWSCCLCTTTC